MTKEGMKNLICLYIKHDWSFGTIGARITKTT